MNLQWQTFNELILDCANKYGEKNAFSLYHDEKWQTLSFVALNEQSQLRATALLQSGHQPGDRIALLAGTSIEWIAQFLAIVRIGCIVVPLDPKATEEELEIILTHVEPKSLVAAKELQGFAFQAQQKLKIKKILLLEVLYETEQKLDFPPTDKKQTAAIYYTSGTSGAPKGVMLSMESLLSELDTLLAYQESVPTSVVFSILPLHHLYGLVAGALYSFACGAEFVFAHRLSPVDIRFCLEERKVTHLFVVPLLLQIMHRSIQEKIQARSPKEKFIFQTLFKISALFPYSIRRKIFSKIHEQIGGRLEGIVSGGAPLDPKTYHFFCRIGLPIYEGYGLTETGPVISVNTPRHHKVGTVGRAIPCAEVKVIANGEESEGEICTRGPHVMQGYFKNPELSREVLSEDGWFHTGDLGRIENGYLRIIGRKKSLIVLHSGKKIYAEEVEKILSSSELFQEICVLGIPELDRGEQVVAVIYPNTKILLQEFEKQKLLIEAEVQNATQVLAQFKRPIRTILLQEPMPKTANGKIRRNHLREKIIREQM